VKHEALTGERPGKIHHEIPGAQLPNREGFTTYNACDTTPLFLIGAEGLSYIDDVLYSNFIEKYKGNVERAVEHILESVDEQDALYWDTTPAESNAYTLRVTYWKDSILPHSEGKEEPRYPVSFAQAHFMAARGLLAASRILDDPELGAMADKMFVKGIQQFITPEAFIVYKDSDGQLAQSSSDELHSLAYIPTEYADILPLDAIKKRAEELATPFGYICTPPNVSQSLTDTYHGDKIWVFEQALIHYGSNRFGLEQEAATASAISSMIGRGQELYGIEYDATGLATLRPEGNDQQLWSVAAEQYFTEQSNLARVYWL